MCIRDSPLDSSDRQKFENLKIQDDGGRHFEKLKIRHILTTLWPIAIKFDTLTQFDPLYPSDGKIFKIWKIKTAAAAISKNRKIAISQLRFDRSLRNLVWWHMLTRLTVLTVKMLKFKKMNDGGGRYSEKMGTRPVWFIVIFVYFLFYLLRPQILQKQLRETDSSFCL